MSRLRDLDQRFIAVAAPLVARWADGLRVRRQGTARRVSGAREIDVRSLATLDERYASRGLLGFFREVPQLMGVVIGIVFVAGTLSALSQKDSHARDQGVLDPGTTATTGALPGDPATTGDALGPAVGDSVSTYLNEAARNLAAVTANSPDDQRVTLVSLGAYYRPAQVASILSGYVVREVYIRDPGAGKDAGQFPLEIKGALLSDLAKAYARTAAAQADSRGKYQMLADTTVEGDPYKPFYEGYARTAAKQAKDYAGGCACVFSALVVATPTQLTSLRARPGIRSLEVAAKGLDLRDLQVMPLLPEVKGIVPDASVSDAPS
jgi:hypothetical protein